MCKGYNKTMKRRNFFIIAGLLSGIVAGFLFVFCVYAIGFFLFFSDTAGSRQITGGLFTVLIAFIGFFSLVLGMPFLAARYYDRSISAK